MIKIKIADLVNSTEALQKLAGTDLKARLAWQVARLLKAAEVEIQSFNETRMNLIKKYGVKNEDGELNTDEKGNCQIIPESVEAFSKELGELIETEVEINANKILIADLDNVEFTPSEMSVLEPFVDFGE